MAMRRRQPGAGRGFNESRGGWRPPPISTRFHPHGELTKEDLLEDDEEDEVQVEIEGGPSSTSLAAKAIRASSASHRDSSLSSAYHGFTPTTPHSSSSYVSPSRAAGPGSSKDSRSYEYASLKSVGESKPTGFWGSLAQKAKSFLDEDGPPDQVESPARSRQQKVADFGNRSKYTGLYASNDGPQKVDSPKLRKGLNAISSSLNYIGNAVEGGLTLVENRTVDIIQETRKHIRKKPSGPAGQNQGTNSGKAWQQTQPPTQAQPQSQVDLQLQLKASRDVSMAMAAKAKLLLRELKTVKADFAFAKERCAQLEDENRVLRQNRERGGNLEDDDMIRLQLETLLAEKARLAHENSVYARENRFLREVVEYHQLTMQDVVYLDEGTEEVTEVYPIRVVTGTQSTTPTNLHVAPTSNSGMDTSLGVTGDVPPCPVRPPGIIDVSECATKPISYANTKT